MPDLQSLLHRQQVNLDDNGQISQSPVDLENSDILTSADGSDIYSIDPFDVQAVSNINGFNQVFFAGSSSVGLEYRCNLLMIMAKLLELAIL